MYLFLIFLTACNGPAPNAKHSDQMIDTIAVDTLSPEVGTIKEVILPEEEKINIDYDSTIWIDIAHIEPEIILDMRYATEDNFVNEKMYDCGRCFLRKEVAKGVVSIHHKLKSEYGYGLKMFDCFRPLPIQWKLWKKLPNPTYVADPRKGSMHNRGAAVDLTIVDENGVELDMGTPFDFFGKKAHHKFTDLPEEVLKNRTLLKTTMEQNGFGAITSEWWHYNFRGKAFEVSEMLWSCE